MHRPEEHRHGGLPKSIFLENYKLWKRNSGKLNCSYGTISHTLENSFETWMHLFAILRVKVKTVFYYKYNEKNLFSNCTSLYVQLNLFLICDKEK